MYSIKTHSNIVCIYTLLHFQYHKAVACGRQPGLEWVPFLLFTGILATAEKQLNHDSFTIDLYTYPACGDGSISDALTI